MKNRLRAAVVAGALTALCCGDRLQAQSYFPLRPDDPRAVEFTKETFGAHADGVADDADGLQQAVNRAQETRAGVVLIPEGRYRLGKTVNVWQGLRLIGYGKTRPVFVLGKDTPGFQEGEGRYMVYFADSRPQGGGPVPDASEFTFYSGMLNVDFELQAGNAAAVAIRFHVAQHSLLAHMNFQVGSARAALEDVGNQAYDIHVHGGQYGIITHRTAPVWQFLLMDSSFDGQAEAAIRTMEAGFTLTRVTFANMPVALQIMPGEVEQLYGRDLRMINIREAVFSAGDWRNSHSEVTLSNIICSGAPVFFADQPGVKTSARHYIENFSLGLEIGPDGREQGIRLRHNEQALAGPPPPISSDIPEPPPMAQWVNARALGAKAEATADDTDALQAAIDRHAAIFLPSGNYRVSRPLMLRSNTVLIGLNPGTTQITLTNGAAAFAGEGAPLGVITAPPGGSNIIRSISVSAGSRNPRAVGVLWMAGENSMLDDVSIAAAGFGGSFGGGFGTNRGSFGTNSGAFGGRGPGPGAGVAAAPTNGVSSGGPGRGAGRGPDSSGTQAGDIIVRGGGGVFRCCWPHDTAAKVGLRVEDTDTSGRIYQMSVEHHMRVETQFQNVHGWDIYALQTEEENPAGAEAYAADIQDSRNLLFANTYMYRVSRNVRPKTHAILVRRSEGIEFQNVKVFSQTRMAFDNAILEEGSGVAVRPQFFGRFTAQQGLKAAAPARQPEVFEKKAKIERLAGGFSNASALAVGNAGEVFFSDAAEKKVYRWNAAKKVAELLAELPGQPQVLGFIAPSNLLAIANEKAVYSIDLSSLTNGLATAQAVKETAQMLENTVLLLPVGLHNQLSVLTDFVGRRGFVYRRGSNTAIVSAVTNEARVFFYAPDSKTAVVGGGTWRPNLQSSQLAAYQPGQTHYVVSEDDGRVYSATLKDWRTLKTVPFAERGGTSVVADSAGNVYVAGGQVWVYDKSGKELGALEIPERPGSLAFGGPDKRTLFIGARSSLYSIRTVAPGE